MLIDVNEEQNKRVEELLDEGIANLGIPIDNTDINIPFLSSKNDIKYNPESMINSNLDNNENYNFNYNTESSFDFINQNNFENNNKIKKELEKKKPNYIYYGDKNRNNNIINRTIDALNTGLIIPSNQKRDIDENKNEIKKNKSYDNCQMEHDKNGFKKQKNKKIPDLINNKNDSNNNLNNDIYEYNNNNNVNLNINHKKNNEDNIIINDKEFRPKDLKMNQRQTNYRNNPKNGLLKNNYSFNSNENMYKNSNSFQNNKNIEYFKNKDFSNSNINNINNNNNYIKIQDNIRKIPINKIIKKQRTKPKIKQTKINYEWKEKYEEIKKLKNNILKQLQKVQKENMIIEDKLNGVKFLSENENISAMKSYLLRKQINYDKLNNDFQISENTRIRQVALIDKLEKEIKYIKSILLRQNAYK